MSGTDLIGLQELGGCGEIATGKWDTRTLAPGPVVFFVVGAPAGSYKCQAVGYPSSLTPHVAHISVQPCGMCVQFRIDGVSTYALSVHLPYLNRNDSQDVWQEQIQCMRQILEGSRYHDNLFLISDLHYELLHATSELSDERNALLNLLERDLGLSHTVPSTFTWSNTRGSCSKIDDILYRTPHVDTLDMQVVEESDHIMSTDHRLVTLCVSVGKCNRRRSRQRRTKCHKWIVDYTKAIPKLNDLAARADLACEDLTEADPKLP